ncbi:MAG: hypothetical protein HFK06_06930 [Clostridia bacterium]|nr:hypothetical protein [Clostridia bacterium]
MNNYNGKVYAYISAALAAASLVLTGVSFSPAGIYALIAAVLTGIASLSFANYQKKKNNFQGLKIFYVAAYAALIVSLAIFVGGLIWSGV